jgi:hypothetical protein
MSGKADAIVRLPEGLHLLEHKTAASLDGNYLDRLWTDTQIALYSHYLRQLGYPIVGVIYNVLLKSRLKQSVGETQEEYEIRRAELAAKNKSGKSSAKRQMPESDEAFQARLAEWYSRPEAFHREHIYLSEDRLAMLQEEVWEITQQYLDARRRGKWLLTMSKSTSIFAFSDNRHSRTRSTFRSDVLSAKWAMVFRLHMFQPGTRFSCPSPFPGRNR